MAAQAEPGQRRLALLIATSDYSDPALRQLRAPGRDAADLAEVLRSPRIGGFAVQTVINARCGELLEAIEEFCADRRLDDQLLIYLSCHGVLDDRGRLYYAAADTRRQRTAATAVAAAWLNERLEDCRARSQIVILDCCYSGPFASGGKGPPDLALDQRFRPRGRGRVVLTASRGTEYSFEGDQPSGVGVQSVFTQAVVDGLRTGDADRDKDGLITVTDIYHHVYERVRAAEPRQTPELWTYGVEGEVLLAYSVRGAVIEPVPLPADLRVTLESPRARVRESAVAELAEFLDAARPGLALSARQVLQQISVEDIPRVAAVARVALEAPQGTAAREVSKELADRDQPERTRQEAQQAARQNADEQARREALRVPAETPGQLGEDLTSTPAPETGSGEGRPRAPGTRGAISRRLVTTAVGVAVIGSLTAIIIAFSTHSPPSTPHVSSTPHVLWTYTARYGRMSSSSPVVAAGVVYVGGFGEVYALDATTGHLRWNQITGNDSDSTPAVAGGTIYVGGENIDGGAVWALDAATGRLRWTDDISSSNGHGKESAGTPAVAGGAVYVGDGSGGSVEAFNATGQYTWGFGAGAPLSDPAVAGGTVYIGGYNNAVWAEATVGNRQRWVQNTGGIANHEADLAVADGTVYIGNWDDEVYALDAATGQVRWTYTTGGPVESTAAVANGTVYIGSNDHKVYALDAATGQQLWAYTIAGGISSPAVAGGIIYVGNGNGTTYALTTAATGQSPSG